MKKAEDKSKPKKSNIFVRAFKEKKLHKKWWFWAIVAGVVVLAIVSSSQGYKDYMDEKSQEYATKNEEKQKEKEAKKDQDKDTNDNEDKDDSSNNKSNVTKWSDMKLKDKESIAIDLCQDANLYTNKIDLSKYDIISLRSMWDSWDVYQDKDAVVDAPKVSNTPDGLPIYSYVWNGNYKPYNGASKQVAKFSCMFSINENNNNDAKILWLSVDGTDVVGSKALVFQD